MAGTDANSQKWLDIARNAWKLLEMAGNCWKKDRKWLEKAGNSWNEKDNDDSEESSGMALSQF